MMTKEEYKKEIVRMWDSIRDDEYKIYNACNGVSCSKYPLHGIGCSEPLSSYEVVEIVKKWSKEHPQKHKISKLEYDILKIYSDDYFDDYFYYFYESELLKLLLEKGYFKGATREMNVKDYFENCEVVD